MNRYLLHEPRPEIDFALRVGSRVKLTEAYVASRELSEPDIRLWAANRGTIVSDLDDRWEVEWDIKRNIGPHPYKNLVMHE